MAWGLNTVTPAKHGAGKGFMNGLSAQQGNPPIPFLREDSKYALEKLSSIITTEDYEDLSNHSTKAMGETGLFSIAQAMIMVKGLMGRCLNRETTLDRLRDKMTVTEEELDKLKAWRVVQLKKLSMAKKARDEFYQRTKELKKVLEEKENEIRHTKDVAVREYRDSDDLLTELRVFYRDDFDDTLHQVKSIYPELDVSTININAQDQSSVQPVHSENINKLFGENAPVNHAQDKGANVEVEDEQACHLSDVLVEEKDGTPAPAT
ncbi:uncharacterized protein LOC136062966 [Quercus suber]|uniref:uncharacterized protein LOC136062966 n=1 Tax=Quercus suber TaxID=58331 RepID=UPI0032DF241A